MTSPAIPTRRIGLVAYDGVLLLNIAGPSELFAVTNRELEMRGVGNAARAAYEVIALSQNGGPVRTSAGITIDTLPLPDTAHQRFDTIAIAGGGGVRAISENSAMLGWLRRSVSDVVRVAAFGGGTLVLARAGLLDGRRCVGHWHYAEHMAEEFPRVTVDREALFVRDGNLLTAAGFTSSMDLALAIVEEDYGKALSLDVAQLLVVSRIRPGEQPQLSAELRAQRASTPRIATAAEWIVANIQKKPTVAGLADRFAMSERNFSRRFTREVGLSPQRFMEQTRLETARRWLSSSTLSIETVAHRSGYSGGEHLAQIFRKVMGTTPGHYREQARVQAANDAQKQEE